MERMINAKRNMIWGLGQKIISIFMPFLVRTAMIYTLGMEYIGLNSLFASILSMLSFVELGFGSAIVFSMYEPIAEEDNVAVCALLAFYRKCYLMIGTIIIGIGLALMPFLNKLIHGNIPSDINLYILFGIYLLNNAAGYFLFAYKQSIFVASQRLDIINKVNLIVNFVSNLTQIVLLLLLHNYYVYIIILPLSTCVSNIIVSYLKSKYYPQYKCEGKVNPKLIQSIKKNVGGLIFQRIGNIVLSSVDTIVISAFLGLKILGVYNGYYYVVSALMGFLAVIQQSLIPSVGNSVVKESIEKNYNDFCKFHFIYLWIVSWCSVCMLILYQPFIKVWQGEDNMLSYTMVCLMVIYFFAYKMGDMSYVYKEAIGLWWQGKLVPLISSIINLIMNIILVKFIGLSGIVISTIVSAVCVNTPFGSRVLFKYYFKSKKDWGRFLIHTFMWFVKCVIACGVTFIATCKIQENIWGMMGKILLCIVLPNIVFVVLNIKNKELYNVIYFLKKSIFKSRNINKNM